ncbi:MAG: lipopolysaccharide biosynthesis protein [Terriglobales bacterium]
MALTQTQFEASADRETTRGVVRLVSRMIEQKRMIGRVVTVAFALIAITAVLIPGDYESTARLMPPEKPKGEGIAAMLATSGGEGGAANPAMGSFLADSLGLKGSGALYVGVLKSTTVQDTLVDQFDLRKVYRKRYRKDADKRLAENTDISEDRKSGIISITVTDHSPQRAQQLAAAYVTTLNQLSAQLNTSEAHRERLFLEERLVAVRQDLAAADKDLSEYSSKNLTLDVKEQGKAMVTGAATLEGELIATESQLSGLEQIYTPNNVRVRSLQARVDLLRKKLSELRGNGVALPSTPGNQNNDTGISLSQLPVLGVTYYDLYRRAKIQETVFEVLTKQYELAKVEEAKELPVIKLLDDPQLPEQSSGPPRVRIILIGTLLAFCAVVGWIWFEDRWERLDLDDPRKATILELSALASVALRPGFERFRPVLQRLARRTGSNGERAE